MFSFLLARTNPFFVIRNQLVSHDLSLVLFAILFLWAKFVLFVGLMHVYFERANIFVLIHGCCMCK